MGYDRKYGKVTTEFGNIEENEPVVVFRAQDVLLGKVLQYYLLFCLKAGSPRRHINLILNSIDNVHLWQKNNLVKVKTPSSESSKDRLPE